MNIPVASTFFVRVLSPSDTFFQGEVYSISAVGKSGNLDILPGHANLMGILVKGNITVRSTTGDLSIGINHGFIHVLENYVEILANV